jgi:hypothetical protein
MTCTNTRGQLFDFSAFIGEIRFFSRVVEEKVGFLGRVAFPGGEGVSIGRVVGLVEFDLVGMFLEPFSLTYSHETSVFVFFVKVDCLVFQTFCL